MSTPSDESRPKGRDSRTDTRRASLVAHMVLNGSLALLFSGLFFQAGSLPSSMWEPLGAGSFPRLILGMLVLINLALVAQQWRRLHSTPAASSGLVIDWLWRHRLALCVLGLFATYLLMVPSLGFTIASFVFLLLAQVLLGARRPRSLFIALVIALAFSIGVDALFRDVFAIGLPRGLLD
ncbi:tripartite tricarboxylate transporter TctB family protein [Halomonas elongata]|uniref:tripartite tricarboxylate transporter TctB family protein n=1 Tax=Halomonas elongata TaxID=2746 RepID=UPI0038D4A3BF